MLEIVIPKQEFFNETIEEFLSIKETKLQLEHSLIAVRKWESKWHIPFLQNKDKTQEQLIDYIRCMTITKNVDPLVYYMIPNERLQDIIKYIEDPQTATTIKRAVNDNGRSRNGEIVTAELIYYWMIALNVPVELEKWNLNQLLTLISVVSIKNSPPKKMGKQEAAQRRAELNAARRAKYGSKG